MKNKLYLPFLALFTIANPINSLASSLPYGIQHNLSESVLISDGFTQIFSTSWSSPSNVSLSTIFAGLGPTTNLFLGVELAGSLGTVYLGAGANFADVTHNTGVVGTYGGNYTNVFNSNGVAWYFNPGTSTQVGSWGFTDIGTTPNKNQCDTNMGPDTLCMHTMNNHLLSGYDIGGIFPSNATLVLFSEPSQLANIPEPTSIALLISGLLGFGVSRNKRLGRNSN